MGDINFSRNLLYLRKERKITQENIANHLGVTKAAVSKWELNQSYPDITLLPIIAGYFDISIDELIGYEPYMEDEEVKKLYKRLIKEFSTDEFYIVYEKCLKYEKEYYTCYFLQLHIGLIYCNHAYLAGEQEKVMDIYNHAVEVFERIEKNCGDVYLAKKALSLKSFCNLLLGKCDEIIEDLKVINQVPFAPENILSKAYQIKGYKDKAINTLQISIFNNFINGIQSMTDILNCYDDNEEKLELYIDKIVRIMDILELKTEYPQALLNTFMPISLIYGLRGDKEKCIKYLQECVDLTSEKKIFHLTGNKNRVFDYLPEFIEGMSVGNVLPRSEELIVESFKDLMNTHPAFVIIRDDIRYENLLKKLDK